MSYELTMKDDELCMVVDGVTYFPSEYAINSSDREIIVLQVGEDNCGRKTYDWVDTEEWLDYSDIERIFK